MLDKTDNPGQCRAILTVLGSDRPGIVACVASTLASHEANILDISQTILQGIFTMTMLVDVGKTPLTFQELSDELLELEKALGVQIQIQREEVFNYMYRL